MNGWKRITALILACFLTAVDAAVLPPAKSNAESEEKTVKEIRKENGTTEVWEFVGVFGSSDDARESTVKKKDRTVLIGGLKFKVKKNPAEDEGAVEKKLKMRSLRRKARTRRLRDIVDKTIPYNQVYIQDNRGSGR